MARHEDFHKRPSIGNRKYIYNRYERTSKYNKTVEGKYSPKRRAPIRRKIVAETCSDWSVIRTKGKSTKRVSLHSEPMKNAVRTA